MMNISFCLLLECFSDIANDDLGEYERANISLSKVFFSYSSTPKSLS